MPYFHMCFPFRMTDHVPHPRKIIFVTFIPEDEPAYNNSAEHRPHAVADPTVFYHNHGRSDVFHHRFGILLHAGMPRYLSR